MRLLPLVRRPPAVVSAVLQSAFPYSRFLGSAAVAALMEQLGLTQKQLPSFRAVSSGADGVVAAVLGVVMADR